MDAIERQARTAAEAAEWWLILQGNASSAQRDRYVDWLRESSKHVGEMLRVAQVHAALEQFQDWTAIGIQGAPAPSQKIVSLTPAYREPGVRRAATMRRRRRIAAAALLLILSCAGVLWEAGRNAGIIQTERGERREVALADGSVLRIDPETRVWVKFEKHLRRVVLESGRALFHVAKDAERPFLVEAYGTSVRAIGTAFAVDESANEAVLVTVSEGTVSVFPSLELAGDLTKTPASGASGLASVGGKTSLQSSAKAGAQLLVTAGQQVSVARIGGPEGVHPIDSARALAWAEGRLIFDDTSVSEAVRQFNRYNRIQIIVEDQTLARKLINGTFDAADPESFAAFLKSVAGARVGRSERADITIDAAR